MKKPVRIKMQDGREINMVPATKKQIKAITAQIKARISEIKNQAESTAEHVVLTRLVELSENKTCGVKKVNTPRVAKRK